MNAWQVVFAALACAACGGGGATTDAADVGSGSGAIVIAQGSRSAGPYGVAIATLRHDRCTFVVDGPCVIHHGCYADATTDVDIGEIAITPTLPAPVVLTVGADGQYGAVQQSTAIFAPGAPLTFTAHGGALPSLSAWLTAPSPITLTAPPPGFALSQAADLPLTWIGSSEGVVEIDLSEGVTGTANVDGAVCQFRASTGAGVVPARVLAQLAPTVLDVGFSSVATALHPTAGWQIATTASIAATYVDGTAATGVQAVLH